jgi:hypothetical protein
LIDPGVDEVIASHATSKPEKRFSLLAIEAIKLENIGIVGVDQLPHKDSLYQP